MSNAGALTLTDLADQALLVPLAIVIGLTFALAGWRQGAIVWATTITCTLGITLVLKLVFLACDAGPDALAELRSPSGHTAAASVIYGGFLALLVRVLTGTRRWTIPCAALIAAVFAQTRLVLGVHTVIEVTAGAMIGIAGAYTMIRYAGEPPPVLRLGGAAAAGLAVMPLIYGLHLPAEAVIATLAAKLGMLVACR